MRDLKKVSCLQSVRYLHTMQNESDDCGIAVIKTILQQYQYDSSKLKEKVGQVFSERQPDDNVQGLSLLDIQEILQKYEIETAVYEVDDIKKLADQEYPVIVMVKNEGMPHYCIIQKMDDEGMVFSDPAKVDLEVVTMEYARAIFMGYAICIEKMDPPLGEKTKKKESSATRKRLSDLPWKRLKHIKKWQWPFS